MERPTFESSAVRVSIRMYSQQLLQGRVTYTAHTDMVHMGRFGSVGTLRGVSGHAIPIRGTVVTKFRPISYGGFIRIYFVLSTIFKAFG